MAFISLQPCYRRPGLRTGLNREPRYHGGLDSNAGSCAPFRKSPSYFRFRGLRRSRLRAPAVATTARNSPRSRACNCVIQTRRGSRVPIKMILCTARPFAAPSPAHCREERYGFIKGYCSLLLATRGGRILFDFERCFVYFCSVRVNLRCDEGHSGMSLVRAV